MHRHAVMTLYFAVVGTLISPTCKGRLGDELEAIRNARCGGPARTPEVVKFALRSKYMRRRTLSMLHARHRDRIPSRDASGERWHTTKKKSMVNEWSHSQTLPYCAVQVMWYHWLTYMSGRKGWRFALDLVWERSLSIESRSGALEP